MSAAALQGARRAGVPRLHGVGTRKDHAGWVLTQLSIMARKLEGPFHPNSGEAPNLEAATEGEGAATPSSSSQWQDRDTGTAA